MYRVRRRGAAGVAQPRLQVPQRAERVDSVQAHNGIVPAKAHVVEPVVLKAVVGHAVGLGVGVCQQRRLIHQHLREHVFGNGVNRWHPPFNRGPVARVHCVVVDGQKRVRELIDDAAAHSKVVTCLVRV